MGHITDTSTNLYVEDFDFFERLRRETEYLMPSAHFHKHHELYYLISGKTNYLIGNNLFVLNAGDFAFIPKGVYHQTASRDISNIERVLIVFDDDMIEESYKPYLDALMENNFIRIHKDSQKAFQSIFRQIEEENEARPNGYEDMRKLYLSQLLVLLARHRETEDADAPTGTHAIIQNAIKYINSNLRQDLRMETLARKYSLSPGYFSVLFRKMTGSKYNEYVTLSRITYAQELLASKKICVTRVAEECGYNDSNYFSQTFKRITGMTPKKYSMQFM